MRVLKAGAAGYLNKTSALNELVTAIRKVAHGGKYVSPALAEIIATELQEDTTQSPHTRLTDREYVVVCLMGAGKSPGEIALELALSPKTISTYRARALHKLGLKTNAELVRYAIENELT